MHQQRPHPRRDQPDHQRITLALSLLRAADWTPTDAQRVNEVIAALEGAGIEELLDARTRRAASVCP